MAADSDGDDADEQTQREPASDGTRQEADDGNGDEGEWRFSLDEIEAREEGNVAGDLARDQPLEPDDVDRENALFVVLGVLLVVVLVAAIIFGF